MNTEELMKLADAYAAERQWANGYSDACMEARVALEAALSAKQGEQEAVASPSEMQDVIQSQLYEIAALEEKVAELRNLNYPAPANQQLLEALKQLVIATQHLAPCPGTMEIARAAMAEASTQPEIQTDTLERKDAALRVALEALQLTMVPLREYKAEEARKARNAAIAKIKEAL